MSLPPRHTPPPERRQVSALSVRWRAGLLAITTTANLLLLMALPALSAAISKPRAAVDFIAQPRPTPMLLQTPTVSPSPAALPGRRTESLGPLKPNDLAPNRALLLYTPANGFPVRVEQLGASCNRDRDGLGIMGSHLEGPTPARYQITIAPFHGSGMYRTDSTTVEIGGSISITGRIQLFIGPPYRTDAEVLLDGAVGELAFAGLGVDGLSGDGILRWSCATAERRA